MSRAPKRQMARRQRRKRKVKHLRLRLEQATSPQQRRQLTAKIRQISPRAPLPGE